MSLLLDTIRAERDKLLAPLRDRLTQLDELERLAHAFDGDGEGAGQPDSPPQDAGALPAAAGKRAAVTKRTRTRTGGQPPLPGRNGGNAPAPAGARAGSAPSGAGRAPAPTPFKRLAVLDYVRANGTVKVSQVARALGLTSQAARQHLKELVKNGSITAEGATSTRVYFAQGERDREQAERPHERTSGVTGSLPDLKRRVLHAIGTDPAALNEDRLALVLNVDREDIAVATGELLVNDQVILMPDGSYRPTAVAA